MKNYKELFEESKSLLEDTGHSDLADDLHKCLEEYENGIYRCYVIGHDKSGKSSLVNLLVGRKVSEVDVAPQIIPKFELVVDWKGHKIVDTCGFLVEREMEFINKIKKIITKAGVVLFLIKTEGIGPKEKDLMRFIKDQGIPLIVVCNKIDVIPHEGDLQLIKERFQKELEDVYTGEIFFISVELARRYSEEKNVVFEDYFTEIKRLEEIIQGHYFKQIQKSKVPYTPLRRTRYLLQEALDKIKTKAKEVGRLESETKITKEEIENAKNKMESELENSISEVIDTISKIEDTIDTAIDAGDREAVKRSVDNFNNKKMEIVYRGWEGFISKFDKIHTDLKLSFSEYVDKFPEPPSHGNIEVKEQVDSEVAEDAARKTKEFTDNLTEDLQKLYEKISMLRKFAYGTAGVSIATELGERVANSATQQIVQQTATQAEGSSLLAGPNWGNVLQIAGVIIGLGLLIYSHYKERKVIQAKRAELRANFGILYNEVKTELRRHGIKRIEDTIQEYIRVVTPISKRINSLKDKWNEKSEEMIKLINEINTILAS